MKKLFLFASFVFFSSFVRTSTSFSHTFVKTCGVCGAMDKGHSIDTRGLAKLWVQEFYKLNTVEQK